MLARQNCTSVSGLTLLTTSPILNLQAPGGITLVSLWVSWRVEDIRGKNEERKKDEGVLGALLARAS